MPKSIGESFANMVGGRVDEFFSRYWRKEVLLTKNAMSQNKYSCSEFLTDYVNGNYLAQTLLVEIDGKGVRRMSKPESGWTVPNADAKSSLVLQAIKLPRAAASTPPVWQSFIDLQYDLCSYLLPDMPPGIQPEGPVAAVDIFYTQAITSTGGHYDPGDVFYFVLDGEKEWTLELRPDPEAVLQLYASPHENFMKDHKSTKTTETLVVHPGDCLYVPPFTYHRVQSTGPTLAVSIGLPTYTEATLIKTLNAAAQKTGRIWHIWEPLPSFPLDRPSDCQAARIECSQKLAVLLDEIMSSIPMIRSAR